MAEENKLWGGRFKEETNRLLELYSESVSYDSILYKADIEGSIAHVKMLASIGVINSHERDLIVKTLKNIEKDIDEKGFDFFLIKYEDVHMNIEAELIKRIGDVGKKIHTARSRNDQIALDMRIYLLYRGASIIESIVDLIQEFVYFAEKNIDIIMPEFTHMQHAQPVLFSHHILAYVEMLSRDLARLSSAMERLDFMPLGSGACVGTGIKIDRELVKNELGFESLTRNSVDAVSDRDYILDFLYILSMVSMHLSRFCEEFILWSGPEFNFIELPDAFCTGSSMMPQKKNPDALELMRGKTGPIIGSLMSVFTTMKGLPLSYNRDMQEDKKGLFLALDDITYAIEICIELLPLVNVNKDACLSAANKGFAYATDIADYLVNKGCVFRAAHEIVGKLIGFCIKQGKNVSDLDIKKLREFSGLFNNDIYEAIKIENCIKSKDVFGGTAPAQVLKQIEHWKEFLDQV